jgi:hypothetical protein
MSAVAAVAHPAQRVALSPRGREALGADFLEAMTGFFARKDLWQVVQVIVGMSYNGIAKNLSS